MPSSRQAWRRWLDIYNPFSLLSALYQREFRDFWYETGTPTFVVKALKQGKFNLEDLTLDRVPASALGGVNADDSDPIPVLYQSGYLTIRSYDERRQRYSLKYPNQEVERGFMECLAKTYIPTASYHSPFDVQKFVDDFEKGDAEGLMKRFEAFFADADYEIVGDAELYFQNTMYVMCKLMGQFVQVERHTSNGRMDIVVQTEKYIYVMELKMDASADEALQQIEEKGYAKPFAADSRKLFKIGVDFSSQTRRIEEWKIQ